jgi:hypothetical protein
MIINGTLTNAKQYFKNHDMDKGYMAPLAIGAWIRGLEIIDMFGIILMPKNVALRMIISISLNFVFGSMNDMSFLTLLSLISIMVPGVAQAFPEIILKFLYLDML